MPRFSFSLLSRTSLQDSTSRTLSKLLMVEDRVLFPDHLLLMVAGKFDRSKTFECLYYKVPSNNYTEEANKEEQIARHPAISTEEYDEFRWIARCPPPPPDFTAGDVGLRQAGVDNSNWPVRINQTVNSWERVVYEAVIDGETAVLFAKGLNLRPHKESDPNQFRCQFGLGNWEKGEGFTFVTEAISAAQEIVRCSLPRSIQMNPEKAEGVRVTLTHAGDSYREPVHVALPSVATLQTFKPYEQKMKKGKYELCACTMLWNQAPALREWIMYHDFLGVERWFIYDNNSDDQIQEVVDELELQDYNVSRHTWPWIKTQEAGFSHCALRARKECKWVGFFDVDEFYYFPRRHQNGLPAENSLKSLVSNFSSSRTIAEIRTDCHSFGPSGLSSHPTAGVTVGYTCRLQSPERHKSIIRPDLLDDTLLNVVHHFQLKEGYRTLNVPEGDAIVNHYKYQVWETFRAKFFRRVATYVVDWQENQNQGSKDRAPGLGTEAIEPPNWRLQFCEVWDTGLRDYVLANFADPATGDLPWKKALR